MQSNDNDKNRGTHGDSLFMLGGVPSSGKNPPASAVGSVNNYTKHFSFNLMHTFQGFFASFFTFFYILALRKRGLRYAENQRADSVQEGC